MKKLVYLVTLVLVGTQVQAKTGTAPVLSSAGRSSCGWVQLWENGPKWATFNVGATITDYANLTVGADFTAFNDNKDQATYYNTANTGGLYGWNQPKFNARIQGWSSKTYKDSCDVASALWGSNWTTPKKSQMDSLKNDSLLTTWIWCDGNTTQYVEGCTLKGYKISGRGDFASDSIFLPAAGYFSIMFGKIYEASDVGYYWETELFDSAYARNLIFNKSGVFQQLTECKYGLSIRAVLVDNTTTNLQDMRDASFKSPNAKFMKDGQLYILRDGKLYTAQGIEL